MKEIPADMWLHVATDALARYAAGGGAFSIADSNDEDGPQLKIVLPVTLADPRLAGAFVALFNEEPTPGGASTSPDRAG